MTDSDTQDSSPSHSEIPLVSIILLTYNHEKYIGQCIDSLLLLNYSNSEIHILDDGSKDGTFAILERYRAEHPDRIFIETQVNSGGDIAGNSTRLLSRASGEYVFFMSGDDVLVPGFDLNSVIRNMHADGRLMIAFSRPVHVNFDDCSDIAFNYSEPFRDLMRSGDAKRMFAEHLCRQVSRLFLQGTVFRRAFLARIGGFDPDLIADDYGLMCKSFAAMADTDQSFAFSERNVWVYRVHPHNIHKDVYRQRELIYQVVARYVPEAFWADFAWDHQPQAADDFRPIYEHMEVHFGEAVRRRILPKMIRRFVVAAVRRMDWRSLWRLACLEPGPTAHAILSRLIR